MGKKEIFASFAFRTRVEIQVILAEGLGPVLLMQLPGTSGRRFPACQTMAFSDVDAFDRNLGLFEHTRGSLAAND